MSIGDQNQPEVARSQNQFLTASTQQRLRQFMDDSFFAVDHAKLEDKGYTVSLVLFSLILFNSFYRCYYLDVSRSPPPN